MNNTEEDHMFDMLYNRPIYIQTNMTGVPYDVRKFDIVRRPETQSFKEDFADWDDFFDSSWISDGHGVPDSFDLHNGLDSLLDEGYSIVTFYTGNRWYATIIPLNVTIQDYFHTDYHAFWDTAFSEDRTFLVSDITRESYPADVDWFEMRRRINYKIRQDVDFAYGPMGVLIPMINYDGSGWFHCHQDEPMRSPTHSALPTVSTPSSTTPSMASSPTKPPHPSQSPSASISSSSTSEPTRLQV